MKIISYYSDIDGSCYYSNHYKRFMKDADTLGIDCHIEELTNGSTYQENCLRKPETIKSILQEVKESVLWVDIDSKIHRNAFLPIQQLPPSVVFGAVAPVKSIICSLGIFVFSINSLCICAESGFVGVIIKTFELNLFAVAVAVRIANFVFPVPVGKTTNVLFSVVVFVISS